MHYHVAPISPACLEELNMTDRTLDLNGWLESYQSACSSVGKIQVDGLKVLERFVRTHQGLTTEVLEAGLAQARLTLGTRAMTGTQALAELLRKQSELGAQLAEKLKARAAEFTALARELQESVGNCSAGRAA
jgi:hypothetical protein